MELGKGPTLVLVHTNGGSLHQYVELLPTLAEKFRVILWDLPGQGDSDPLCRHYSIEDYCSALAELLDAMHADTAHVAGCSCGGTISAGFGSLYAKRTLSVTIMEAPFRTEAEWRAYWPNIEANFGIPLQSRAEVERRLNVVDDAVLHRWNADRNKAGAKTMVDMMWAMRDFDIGAHVRDLRCPTKVIYGAKGPALSMRARFTEAREGIAIHVLAGSGHFPMLDEPQNLCQLLKDV